MVHQPQVGLDRSGKSPPTRKTLDRNAKPLALSSLDDDEKEIDDLIQQNDINLTGRTLTR